MDKINKNTVSFGRTDNPYFHQKPEEDVVYIDREMILEESVSRNKDNTMIKKHE